MDDPSDNRRGRVRGWFRDRVRNVSGWAADNIFKLALLALAGSAGTIASWAYHAFTHRRVLIFLSLTVVALALLGIIFGVIKTFRDERRRRVRERAADKKRFRFVEYQKELLYNALESIQQAVASNEDWRLDELVERGVLGPVRGLLTRTHFEDVRLSVLVTEDDINWKMRWAAGHRPESVRNYSRPIDTTLAGHAYRSRSFVVRDDVDTDPSFIPNPKATRPFRSLVASPLQVGDETVGALSVVSTEPSAFDAADVSFIKAIAAVLDVLLALERDVAKIVDLLKNRPFPPTEDASGGG